MRFRAVLALNGKTATGIEVPAKIVAALGESKRPAVRVTLGPHTYRTTVAPMGGVFMLPVSAEHRTAAGVSAGDELDVDIELDSAPREVEVPPDFAEALSGVPGLRQAFDALAFSHRKEHVRAIEDAKTAETRQRRIAKAVSMIDAKRA
jgi:Bacteriocin-protection, YdeI or OmpD-Associated/Domain of unknown function (DUF1905)